MQDDTDRGSLPSSATLSTLIEAHVPFFSVGRSELSGCSLRSKAHAAATMLRLCVSA
jgi:hypothetical protein